MPSKSPENNPLRTYIEDFLEYCEIERNRSPKTIIAYRQYLYKFLQFTADIGITKPENINLEVVRKFRLHLHRQVDDEGKSLKLISQSYYIIALRSFLKYLAKRDVKTLSAEKIELPKNPSRQVESINEYERHRLFKIVEAATDNHATALRDIAILQTLFSSGIRVSELASLKIQSVDLDRGEFTVRGKGDKLRLTFLSPEAVTAIRDYLAVRIDNHPSMFVAHGRSNSVEKQIAGLSGDIGLTPRSIQRLVKKYAMLAGITHKVSPHTLRHSFATDLLQNGADIRSVQTLLGHSSITTTQIYTHVTNQGLREVHNKYHGKKEETKKPS